MTQNERRSLPIWKRIVFWLVTLLLFSLQIIIFTLLFQINFYNRINIYVYLTIQIIGILLVIYIVHRPVIASYKLTWSIFILIMPLPFSLLYFLNYRSKRLPKYKRRKIDQVTSKYQPNEEVLNLFKERDPKGYRIGHVLSFDTQYYAHINSKFTFLNDGYLKFLDLLKELDKAQKYILIETFIISEGFYVDELLSRLKKKGTEGVEIKIIYDDLGSKMRMKSKTIKDLTAIPNCRVINYNPLGLNINPAYNYRDHRKIIVIDGKVAYCGGDNIADEYIHKIERFGFWRDNCGKYEGEAVQSFIALFLEMWYMCNQEVLKIENYLAVNTIKNSDSFILPFGDGPSYAQDVGYDAFRALIGSASHTLYISTPYFILDDAMLEAILLACKSGVDVRILMPGIPDKKSVYYLGRYYYQQILNAGGKIYEFKKGFNHAKNIIVDGKYAFIGTINMDYRSLFLHYECGAVIFFDEEIKSMHTDFLKTCEQSQQITMEDWKNRPWYQKLVAYLFFVLAPLF